MSKIRKDHELPESISEWGWRYHHMGIPTRQKMKEEKYIPHLKFYVSGFSESPFGIEWMRFDPDCPLPEMVKNIPHIAFEVDDLDYELEKRKPNILIPPNPPSEGVRVAMIEHNGAPVELLQFER